MVSESPIFKFAPRPQSSLKGEVLVGMTACLYKAFEHADDEGKSSIDVLRNIVTKQVSLYCYLLELYMKRHGIMVMKNCIMVYEDTSLSSLTPSLDGSNSLTRLMHFDFQF